MKCSCGRSPCWGRCWNAGSCCRRGSDRLMHKVPTPISLLLGSVVLLGCLSKVQPRILPADTTWIQRSHTTREEVITRFGKPDRSMAKKDQMEGGEYVEYGRSLMPDLYAARGYTSPFEPRPRGGGPAQLGGAAPQVYRPPIESLRFPGPAEAVQPFWLHYDGQGVVRDFGFGLPTTAPEEPST